MVNRTLEIMFRHRAQLLLLLVAPIAISLAVALALPSTYQAKATLWALRLYQTDSSQAGVAAVSAASNGQPTPAGTQAAVLTELLRTHVFAASVAEAAGIGSTSGSPASSDALLTDLSSQIQVAAAGDHLVAITYSNEDPRMAQQVVQAVIQQYALFMGSQQTGPQSTAAPEGTAAPAFYNILDAPTVPSKPESQRTRLLLAGGAGLCLAILASTLYVVMLVRRDHSLYDVRDVHDAAGVTVIMQLPTLSPAAVNLSGSLVSSAGRLDGNGTVR